MQLLPFLNKYEHKCNDLKIFQSKSFKSNWNLIKELYKDDISSIRLLFGQLIEKKFPAFLIKELFNLYSDKEEITKDRDFFKWAAAFHGKEIINFLYLNMEVKDELGAANAAIINFRLDNLKTLSDLGINVFNEKNFCQAIARSNQPKSSEIIEYYLENKDKFQITDYGINRLKEHTQLIGWVMQNEDFEKIRYLIKQGVGFNKNDLFRSACMDGSLNRVKYILYSKDFDMVADKQKLTTKQIEEGFIWAATSQEKEHKELVEYFIFEYKIKYSKGIKKEIKSYKLDEVQKLFQIRDNHNALSKELSNQNEVAPTKKLKI